ncbi:hypothetical protein E4T39_06399 [Aureobasidium subglaciale]|nr:hypothetical protein E4T39_06399 [Aureobasidium subglaciale]
MPTNLHLGCLHLSSPSTGLDLALASNAFISTLAACSFLDTPSITNIGSDRIWVAPATSVQLILHISWPYGSFCLDTLSRCLIDALRHAALWDQLNLQPSLAIEPSPDQNTSLRMVLSLTSISQPSTNKKAPVHRLGKDVPCNHLKPPDGLPHWTLDRVHLKFDIKANFRSKKDAMLFEGSTRLESQATHVPSSTDGTKRLVDLIDAALRLAITSLPPKALSGVKVIERSSFKHLDNICPAMWSPGHIEVDSTSIALSWTCTDDDRPRLLPHEHHAMSHSIPQRAHSTSLKEKLREIARQENATVVNNQCPEPQTIQKAVSMRLWQLMQRRLHDPSAGRALKSIKISDSTLPASEHEEDVDDILDLDDDLGPLLVSQASAYLELDDLADDLDLLDSGYGDEWEDFFTDSEVDESLVEDDMLDCSHRYDEQISHDDQSTAINVGPEVPLKSGEKGMLELDDWDDLDML